MVKQEGGPVIPVPQGSDKTLIHVAVRVCEHRRRTAQPVCQRSVGPSQLIVDFDVQASVQAGVRSRVVRDGHTEHLEFLQLIRRDVHLIDRFCYLRAKVVQDL